ncbi:MAG: hypothetical protein IKP86_09675 [Anaerolineaceae bacterium]|nr:hypothetical protein [Anaerolineaceae bacterium]
MKKVLLFFILIPLFSLVLPCFAEVDPILIKKPNPYVHECTEELVIETLGDPIIVDSTGNVIADNYFFVLKIEFLYLQDWPWDGLDKSSFLLRHVHNDGSEEIIPLNYMMTSMLGIKNGWKTMADQYELGTLVKMNLVFDVNTNEKNGWSLVFRPAERGDAPSCELNIPLNVRKY